MMKKLFNICILLAVLNACLGILKADIDPVKVLVLANQNSPDSVTLAHYYIEKRSIPLKNVIMLELPLEEEITWNVFIETLYNPLLDWAVGRGWIKASPSGQHDGIGRKLYGVIEHYIDFIVLSKDVPLKIKNDESLIPNVPVGKGKKEFMVNHASVDGEIALLPFPQSATIAFSYNPLFEKINPGSFSMQQMVRVSRLDGPTYADAQRLIDSALYAEYYGLTGRAYIDMSQKYPQGDLWLKKAGSIIESMGFDVSYNAERELIGWESRFDAPTLYFGWWARHPEGPVSDPLFAFPIGAVGIHIHSFSANTIRSETRNWVGPLVSRGIAGTVGNVYEPFLQFTHHPDLFMEAIKKGKTLGEAAYYSLPALSWQEILIGDPMYKPMKVSLDEQLALIDQEPFQNAQYVVIRKMNLLMRDGLYDQAAELGISYFNKISGLALLFSIGKCQFSQGLADSAMESFNLIDYFNPLESADLAIAYEMAIFLEEMNADSIAIKYYKHLLSQAHMNEDMLLSLLQSASSLAQKLSMNDLVNEWDTRLRTLTAVTEELKE